MYFLQVQTRPKPGSAHSKHCGGAYVNSWVNFALADGAKLLASQYVSKAGWEAPRRIKLRHVKQRDCRTEEKGRRYFREAVQDGISLVFQCYPVKQKKSP
jgi:hypothetical protein